MRSAPPLRIFISDDRAWALAHRGLSLGSAALMGTWLCLQVLHLAASELAPTWSVVLAAGMGGLAWAGVRRGPQASLGELCWDGRAWTFTPHPATAPPAAQTLGRVRVRIDLGAWMLLSFHPVDRAPSGPTAWLPLARKTLAPRDWHTLRCAVYSARPELTLIHDR